MNQILISSIVKDLSNILSDIKRNELRKDLNQNNFTARKTSSKNEIQQALKTLCIKMRSGFDFNRGRWQKVAR